MAAGSRNALTGSHSCVQVTKEHSSKVEELHERYAGALKKRDQAEAAKKKAEMDLQKVQVRISFSPMDPSHFFSFQINIDSNAYNLEDTNRQLTKYKVYV